MKNSFLIIVFSFIVFSSAAQFDPYAGVVESYASTAQVYCEGGENVQHINDGVFGNYWMSDGLLPINYLKKKENNYLFQAGRLFNFSNVRNAAKAYDGDLNTSARVLKKNGKAGVTIRFSEPMNLQRLSLKLNVGANVRITLIDANKSRVMFDDYTENQNYTCQKYSYTKTDVDAIILESDADFDLFELGVLMGDLRETVLVDFGAIKKVGWIDSRHYCEKGVKAIILYASENKQNWKQLASLSPDRLFYESIVLDEEINARYLKYVYVLDDYDYSKAFLWELKVYDKYGPFGARPHSQANNNMLTDILGLNVFWGMGHNKYDDELSEHQGVSVFKPLLRNLRNYHNIDWDITNPGNKVDYSKMALGQGTLTFDWLNWNREYGAWKASGFDIQVSLQFNHRFLEEENWGQVSQNAYDYAYNFASHFTKTHHLITAIEVGNEPWEMEASFYRSLLSAMTKGIKSANPNVKVMPCALNSVSPEWEERSMGAFSGNFLDANLIKDMDVYNAHHYSYILNEQNKQVAVHPENRCSSFWAILNDLRFVEKNMPGKPIYVTEWGWDSDGAGEDCLHDQCVSEEAQAMYAVRALMIYARLGIEKAYWFFYANDNGASSLYSRSGLLASAAQSFAKKASFNTLEKVMDVMGKTSFIEVLSENDNVWAYAFGNNHQATHIVAWRPIPADDDSPVSYTLDKNYKIKRVVRLDGKINRELLKHRFKNNTIYVGTEPLLIELDVEK